MARLILPMQQEESVLNKNMNNANTAVSKNDDNELKPLVVKNIEIIGNKQDEYNDSKAVEVYSFAQQAPRLDKDGKNISNSTQTLESSTDINSTDDIESNKENNNDRILSLHKKGMSSVDIAKELGLGVGEVKLVINLFKGTV